MEKNPLNRSRSKVTPEKDTTKHLPNGDLYIGTFLNNAPHGVGVYIWKDGCKYEGEWKNGKAYGKGKFNWASGARYEGEFKSGRMDGNGVFIGSGGDCYSGGWVADKKDGNGEKWFVNGDYYCGEWKGNLLHGVGKYVWRNGGYYFGEWRFGAIFGSGVLVLEDNTPGRAAAGRARGPAVGDDEKKRISGTGTGMGMGMGMGREGLWVCDRKDGKAENWYGNVDCKMTEEMGFPRICIWESEGEAGDITCDIVGDGFSGLVDKVGRSPCCFIKEAKKPGSTISKGHKNYDLMLNLQLGIRYSVGKHSSMLGELKPKDFDPMEKFWTRFPPEGSKLTPTHKSNEFRWKDYCPMVFRHLRDLFQVDTADYMLAICGNHALRELSSPGKSGSFFYLTQDDRFMIKTVKKSEVKVLLRMLPSYYQHVYRYENTLVTRFYGVHCVKPAGGQKTRFIVMGNLFCSEYRIHRRFDLKGSRHGRTTKKAEGDIDETTTLKDLDLDFVFRLQRNWYQELIKQIERDCEFLEAEKIMDYSLLVGIHFRNDNTMDKMGLSPFVRRGKKASYQNEKYLRGQRFLEAELQDMDRVLAGRKPLIRLGANMPARAERLGRRSDFDQYTPGGCGNLMPSRNGDFYEVILYFGVIDILQDYDISKKLEHAYKSLQADPTTISAVDPRLYSKRFRDFIGRIFVEDR